MAKLQKKNGKSKGQAGNLEILYPESAGIDVSATEMQVCVPPSKCGDNNRTFGTTTDEIGRIVAWLKENGIVHIAMEATGVYWIPLFLTLCRNGMRPVLLNAADVKNYTARKTDVNDAEWLMTLMRFGMVKPSFQPGDIERELRNYTRHRGCLTSLCSDCIRRMQKCMEQMNMKLAEVVSDITGRSGIRIIEAVIAGERDSARLAALARGCKKSHAEIEAALKGQWNESLIFLMGQHYEQYRLLRRQTADLDGQMEAWLHTMMGEVLAGNGGAVREVTRSGKKPKRESNRFSFDLEGIATQILGVNLMRVDGISGVTLLTLLGELGPRFTDSFRSAAHFCSWCNLSPNDKVSGGKILSSRRRKGSNIVGNALRNCAQSLAGSKSPLGHYYRRMKARGGGKHAVCATAHKLATIIYTMVRDRTEYDATKVTVSDTEWLQKKIKIHKGVLKKLEKQLSQQAV